MPEKTGWTGSQVAVLVIVLIVTNAVTASVMFFAFPAAPGTTALTVYHPWSGSERDLFKPVLNAFTDDTGIIVQDRTFRQEDLQTLLPPQFTAGTTPADVIFMPAGFIRQWGEEGWAMDVTNLITEADFVPGTLDPLKTTDGTFYGAAFTFKVKPGFWYKDSVFTDMTWDKNPTTFNDFIALLTDIQNDGVDPIVSTTDGWPLSDMVEHFIATYGGAQMHQDLTANDGTLLWTDASVRTVFEDFIVPTIPFMDPNPVEWTVGVSKLDSDDNAMYFQGSWLPTMSQTSDESDMRAMPLPGVLPEAQQGVVSGVDYVFIPAFTTRSAEAQQLLEFLISAEGQTIQITQGGHFPTNLNADLTKAPPTYDPDLLVGDKVVLPDLDDTIASTFQDAFWAQLLLLRSDPTQLGTVLDNIQAAADEA